MHIDYESEKRFIKNSLSQTFLYQASQLDYLPHEANTIDKPTNQQTVELHATKTADAGNQVTLLFTYWKNTKTMGFTQDAKEHEAFVLI